MPHCLQKIEKYKQHKFLFHFLRVMMTLIEVLFVFLQMILLVGSPGSGKSHFAAQHALQSNYHIINRDTLGTWQKCAEAVEKALDAGRNVIVDNTVRSLDILILLFMSCKRILNVP